MTVCKNEDDYVQWLQLDKGQAIWIAELTNGETVYQDDYRPDASHHSAWVRLASYLEQERTSIRTMHLKFRSNRMDRVVPENAEGYYFSKTSIGVFGLDDKIELVSLGSLHSHTVMLQRWNVPTLTLIDRRVFEAFDTPCLIRNAKHELEKPKA